MTTRFSKATVLDYIATQLAYYESQHGFVSDDGYAQLPKDASKDVLMAYGAYDELRDLFSAIKGGLA